MWLCFRNTTFSSVTFHIMFVPQLTSSQFNLVIVMAKATRLMTPGIIHILVLLQYAFGHLHFDTRDTKLDQNNKSTNKTGMFLPPQSVYELPMAVKSLGIFNAGECVPLFALSPSFLFSLQYSAFSLS